MLINYYNSEVEGKKDEKDEKDEKEEKEEKGNGDIDLLTDRPIMRESSGLLSLSVSARQPPTAIFPRFIIIYIYIFRYMETTNPVLSPLLHEFMFYLDR